MTTTDRKMVETIARICHQTNKAYCESLGDTTQVDWEAAPLWQQNSAINGVDFHLNNPGVKPEDSHNNWLEEKRRDGWRYGPVKNPETKEHPCFLPYEGLPVAQQTKDKLFIAVVRAMTLHNFYAPVAG